MRFSTAYEYGGPVTTGDFSPSLTDAAGYRTVRTQVETLVKAGERLDMARAEEFDYPEGVSDVDVAVHDPTRSGGFDLADATALERSYAYRLEQLRLERKARSDAKAAASAASAKADAAELEALRAEKKTKPAKPAE